MAAPNSLPGNWRATLAVYLHRRVITLFFLGFSSGLLILALISTYRICDVVMGIMANPFYVDLGYTKQEVATISKLYGVMVDNIGYSSFFTLTAAMGIPSLLLILVAWKYVPASKEKTDEEEVVGENTVV